MKQRREKHQESGACPDRFRGADGTSIFVHELERRSVHAWTSAALVKHYTIRTPSAQVRGLNGGRLVPFARGSSQPDRNCALGRSGPRGQRAALRTCARRRSFGSSWLMSCTTCLVGRPSACLSATGLARSESHSNISRLSRDDEPRLSKSQASPAAREKPRLLVLDSPDVRSHDPGPRNKSSREMECRQRRSSLRADSMQFLRMTKATEGPHRGHQAMHKLRQ